MSNTAVFDHVAGEYDDSFTRTRTGLFMRERVRNLLQETLAGGKNLRILEINCGTGEDSCWLAQMGHLVTGTDLSEEMICQAENKKIKSAPGQMPAFRRMGFEDISALRGETFDLVFSNFGGLNCVDAASLRSLSDEINHLLKPGGKFVAVVMPRGCWWESLYFMAKLKMGQAFRRKKRNSVPAKVGNGIQPTWYYSPREFRKIFGDQFRQVKLRPAGFFIPPSYLDPFFSRRPRLLNWLRRMENRVGNWSLVARNSDHFYLELEKKA